MGSYKIRRLNLPQLVIEMLEKQHLNSCKDVLSHSKLELQTLLGMNRYKIDSLWLEVCRKCVSTPQTAYDIYKSQQSSVSNGFLQTTLHALDLLLQGGLPFRNITEITGPPGVGKTQFSFMLSILTALPASMGGLESHVIYIDTESAFCAERLKAIARSKFPQLLMQEDETIKILKRIFLHKVNSVHDLKEILPQLETEVIRNNVKLIVFDSVASLVRKEFSSEGMSSLMERNKLLLELAATLKDLAQTYNLVVFLTNQIASHITEVDSILPVDCISDDEDNGTGKNY
ncbi:hypothetical protein JTE90_025296 [Oedothorax gibbosus]|uniref:RecA family profile 1 domain-containing protein n=1 Tax=Oedothorax gibbosus TaxID=931172 RepID=A0AAV6V5N0_9ARAC|nr:hypothetical protein JTE90_025296 [Oedothorax gibbosus]